MIRWHTINDTEDSDESTGVEIQTEKLLDIYQNALRTHQVGEHAKAKAEYEYILNSNIMIDEDLEEQTKGDSLHSSSLVMLRFLVFKNYAAIIEDESDNNDLSKNEREVLAKKAMDYYLKALMIDPTERSLWYRLGKIAYSLRNLRLTRLAFEKGFFSIPLQESQTSQSMVISYSKDILLETEHILNNGNISPIQWKCLNGLCQVLYDIGDYDLCKFYLAIGLQRFPSWELGLKLNNQIISSDNDNTQISTTNQNDKDDVAFEYAFITIKEANWELLLKGLLKQYKLQYNMMESKKNIPSKKDEDNSDDDDSISNTIINKPIRIQVEMEVNIETKREGSSNENKNNSVNNITNQQSTTVVNTNNQPLPIEANDTIISNEKENDERNKMDIDNDNSTRNEKMDVPENNTSYVINNSINNGESETSSKDNNNKCLKRKHDEISSGNDGNSNSGSEGKDNVDDDKDEGRDNDDDNDDDDDDDTPEVKRSSLRAAKKQKEKEEIEEASKKKMLEEEKQLCEKIQDVFDVLKDIDIFNRPDGWFMPINSIESMDTINAFWDYFDKRLSELGVEYAWTYDNLKYKDNSLFSFSNKYQHLHFQTIKSKSSDPLDDRSVLQFIESLNQINSGISDSLIRTTVFILIHGSNLGHLSKETSYLLSDSVELLGQESLAYLLYGNHHDMKDNDNEIEGLVRLCELLVDQYISCVKNDQLSASSTNLSTKSKLASDKRKKIMQRESQLCMVWIGYLERLYITNMILSFNPYSPVSIPESQRHFLLRYWSLKGKIAQCNNDIEDAYEWYKKCDSLLDSDDMNLIEVNLYCQYDPVINQSTIKSKLKQLEIGKRLLGAQLNFSKHKYEEVLLEIEDLVQSQLNMGNMSDSNDFYTMAAMVAKSYVETNRYLEAWKCYITMLTAFISEFINYGASRKQTNSIPKGDTDIDFFRLLKLIDLVMKELVSLLTNTNCESWFPKKLDSNFMDNLMIFLRTTIFYIFRHPDYIPLVNNFTVQDVLPHRPSKRTKTNFYNALTTKSWLLLSILMQQNINGNEEKIALLSELLLNLHDELGEREICGTSNGMFLRYVMKILTIDNPDENRRGIYQCYHCLYGIHLTADGELLEEHHGTHTNLCLAATEHLYSLVIDDVLEKIERNIQLKNDLKDVVDIVSDVVCDMPTNNRYVDHNKNIIEAYLNDPIDIAIPLKYMLKKCNLPVVQLKNKSPSISVIYDHIFWIRGKMLRTNIKNRPKGSSDKTMSDLEEAIEQLKCHIILHPDDQQCWLELGLTLKHLSEEELTWSASNIKTHKNEIISYQQQAYHSFMQVWYLSTVGKSIKYNQLFGYFTEFGLLVYSMACSPMKMASFQITKGIIIMNDTGDVNELITKKVKPSAAYQLTIQILSKALNFKSTEKIAWKPLYNIGLCYNNLSRPPKEVLDWLLKSIHQCRRETTTSNVLECTYKFCSFLVKFLYNDAITPEDASYYLNLLPCNSRQPANPQPVANCLYPAAEHSNSMTGVIDLTLTDDNPASSEVDQGQESINSHNRGDKMKVFNALFDKLIAIRKSDKRHIQHRLVYKIAWMYYHIYNNPDQAKSEILQLFTLKQTNKGLISVWKTDIERPGKSFVFVHQYVTFLIELAKETDDIDVLKHLCRKLKRASAILLNEEEDFKLALAVYLDIIQNRLLANNYGSDRVEEVLNKSIDKVKVDTLINSYIKDMQKESNGKWPELISVLHDLLEIRKITLGFAPVTTLDDAIRECFCCILYDYINIDSLLNETMNEPKSDTYDNNNNNNNNGSNDNNTNTTANNDATNASSLSSSSSTSTISTSTAPAAASITQKIGAQTLLVQAKTMINNIYGNQK